MAQRLTGYSKKSGKSQNTERLQEYDELGSAVDDQTVQTETVLRW